MSTRALLAVVPLAWPSAGLAQGRVHRVGPQALESGGVVIRFLRPDWTTIGANTVYSPDTGGLLPLRLGAGLAR